MKWVDCSRLPDSSGVTGCLSTAQYALLALTAMGVVRSTPHVDDGEVFPSNV